MTVNVDFRNGAVNSFAASGSPSYSPGSGASFTVVRGGDAPQLNSLFYIMFGRVDITMKAAPGAGIVSSLVLESDDLDEIDLEWLGANPDEMQSNYFGKGRTTSYNRGQFHSVQGTQAQWIKYTVDWTKDRIVWMAGGKVVRTLAQKDAEQGQYPQTPMRIKFGSWSGGDPNTNAAGTVSWARGPTDYSKGPFTMQVQSVVIADYSTGKEYKYKDTSGAWGSIEAVGGAVNGNLNGNVSPLTITASAVQPAATTAQLSVPVGGIGSDGSPATRTQTGWPWVAGASPTGGTIPSGWYMTPNGKIMRSDTGAAQSSSAQASSLLAVVLAPLAVGVLSLVARIY
ncbi:glycosidase CRH1 [Tolypocladium capitatum]|uniref:chitinase n=1 Tax=Tolypocladium capitatum TaxID=45235 RepID=A0A2K3Q454_9HYPO|nr:glycosidase CRH1 [Tolypocladium capitatum]